VDGGRRSREHILSAVEVFGADLETGVRVFADGRVVRDVDALDFGIATTGEIEAARVEARVTDQTAILVRLAEIFNNIGTITGRHTRLRKRDGKNKPPFFYWGRARREFDGRTPWWISADRRESYLNMVFLEEYGTPENLVALLESKAVSGRILLRFVRKTSLREEIAARLERAYAAFVSGSDQEAIADDDPVQDLASAVLHPEDWARPRVSLMLRQAADEGLDGTLAALYPAVMDDRLLRMLWERNFVSDNLYEILYRSGMTAAELMARGVSTEGALSVNTGELNGVLEAASQLTNRAG